MLAHQPQELWDVARASQFLGVPVGTVYSWVEADPPRLPHLKLGRAVRFDPDELIAWAREQRREVAS
jgi:excisionase family DNA binding protein